MSLFPIGKCFMSTKPKIDWKQWDHLLGKEPDRSLARQIGCSYTAVQKRRRELNILPVSAYAARSPRTQPHTHLQFVFTDGTGEAFMKEAESLGLNKQAFFRLILNYWLRETKASKNHETNNSGK